MINQFCKKQRVVMDEHTFISLNQYGKLLIKIVDTLAMLGMKIFQSWMNLFWILIASLIRFAQKWGYNR